MGCLSKNQILNANDVKMEKVFVPELADGDESAYVMVRSMTAKQRDKWDDSNTIRTGEGTQNVTIKVNMENYRARLCVLCLADDDGTPLFTLDDVTLLTEKSAVAVQRIFEACQRVNGLNQEAVKETEKN